MTESKPQDSQIAEKRSFKDTQFKKGQSGNPRGRPKRKLNERRLTDKEVLEALASYFRVNNSNYLKLLMSEASKRQ